MTPEQFSRSKREAVVTADRPLPKTDRHGTDFIGPARTDAQQPLVRRDPRPP
jgi:hypothetical protein